MKKIIRTTLTAGLLAFFAAANAQEADTTTYSNTYNQDTTSYEDSNREQQGSDTYNNTQNETEYSDTEKTDTYNQNEDSNAPQGRSDQQTIEQGVDHREYQRDESRSGMYDDPTTRPGYDEQQERARQEATETTIYGRDADQDTTDVRASEAEGQTPGQGTDYHRDHSRSEISTDTATQSGWNEQPRDGQDRSDNRQSGSDYENNSSDSYDTQDRSDARDGAYSPTGAESLETGNEKDDRAEYPETSSTQRGWNQEAGTEPVENQDTSIHNQQDPVRQEGLDKNKDYNHTGDQSYNDEQPKNTGIGSEDEIGPGKKEAHRQAREELSTATDTLNYESQRNADPDRVGNRVENMADTVHENIHEKDRAKHGLED